MTILTEFHKSTMGDCYSKFERFNKILMKLLQNSDILIKLSFSKKKKKILKLLNETFFFLKKKNLEV